MWLLNNGLKWTKVIPAALIGNLGLYALENLEKICLADLESSETSLVVSC